MTNETIDNWIMYHEIHKLKRLGFSNSRIARYLVIDPRTADRYVCMSEDQYEQYLIKAERKKILAPYEAFVEDRLSEFPDTSSAQIHDWLKEHYEDLPKVTPRSVFNFVMHIRQKYNIPYVPATRDFSPVEELSYGYQAQVDFGEYNMRSHSSRRKKVYFFAMVMSRSRMKFVWFIDRRFTTVDVIMAHEKAFAFFAGMPRVVVYDLDKTMVVDENLGEIILTSRFRSYTQERGPELHFCRKADPQSKGKVENVIQYIKKNFLYNRFFYDIDTLNSLSIGWLGRTANYLPHNYTKIPPKDEFLIEQQYLTPYYSLTLDMQPEMKEYTIRKTNVINYKSNFYTLPPGSYKGSDSIALVREEDGKVLIHDTNKQLICSHVVSKQKGKTISNTNHKRDTTKSLEQLQSRVEDGFSNKPLINDFLGRIKQKWPRYSRDHFQAILRALSVSDKETADKTLAFCIKNSILHGNEFEQALLVILDERSNIQAHLPEIKLLNGRKIPQIDRKPKTSNLDDYENIINQ